MTAIGFIETMGLVGAVEAADAMLKAADVRLLEKSLATGGLVTITVAGEVAAVQSAVDAAVASIGHINGAVLVSRHVIPRPDQSLSGILATAPKDDDPSSSPVAPAGPEQTPDQEAPVPAEESVEQPSPEPETPAVEALPEETEAKPEPAPDQDRKRFDISKLEKMKVAKLRQIARSLKEIAMSGEEVKAAKKEDLIKAILNANK